MKNSNNEFSIITVKKMILVHYWYISIYIPKSGRTFATYIDENIFSKWSVNDLKKLFSPFLEFFYDYSDNEIN